MEKNQQNTSKSHSLKKMGKNKELVEKPTKIP